MRALGVLVALVTAFMLISSVAVGEEEFSITGKPRWFEVKSGEKPVVARALSTHSPLGQLSPGTRLLSFGITDSWVTFAWNGQIAYVPTSALSEVYPKQIVETKWRGFGPSVEDKLKEQKSEIEKRMNSEPLYKPKETPGPNQEAGTAASGNWKQDVRSRTVEALTPTGGRGGGYY